LNEEKVDIGDTKVDIKNEKLAIQDKKVDIEGSRRSACGFSDFLRGTQKILAG